MKSLGLSPAPDIAKQGIANPTAMILSSAMMLTWLVETYDPAVLINTVDRLQTTVDSVIAEGAVLMPDLGGTSTTSEATVAISNEWARLAS